MSQTKNKKYKISFSEYSSFLQCPNKWFLNYALGLPGDLSEELIFGTTTHNTIQDILTSSIFSKKSMLNSVVKSNLKKELSKITDLNFLEKFNKQGLPFVFPRQITDLINELDFKVQFKDYEVVNVEYKLDNFHIITLDDIEYVFKGYIDLILRHKHTGKYLLLDWKTSKKKWDIKKKMSDQEFFSQLCLYKYFYSKKAEVTLKKIECKYYNLPREEPKEQLSYTGILNEETVESVFIKLQEVCKKIHYHNLLEFPKAKFITKNNYCHRCNFNSEKFCDDENEFQDLDLK